jgi:small subunit ribosomal protein S20
LTQVQGANTFTGLSWLNAGFAFGIRIGGWPTAAFPKSFSAYTAFDLPVFRSHTKYSGVFVPNIQSAKKDLRKSRAAAVRNRAQRSALRTAVKKAKVEASTTDVQLTAVSLLDRAARKGLIHRNTAARQKSKIAKLAAASA